MQCTQNNILKGIVVALLGALVLMVLLGHGAQTVVEEPPAQRNHVHHESYHVTHRAPISPTVQSNDTVRYGLIFDMGSSGTRVHVYRWHVDYPLRSVIEVGNLKTAPGISYYAETAEYDDQIADRVYTSLLPLLSFARTLTPPNHRSNCRVHAKCTAGCRLLTKHKQTLAIKGVQEALSQSGFMFRDWWARVIPGEEEALLDWVAINAALGLLHTAQDVEGAIVNVPTVGVMDVGGASAQITYSVSPIATHINPGDNFGRTRGRDAEATSAGSHVNEEDDGQSHYDHKGLQGARVRKEVYEKGIYGSGVRRVLPDASTRTVTPYGHAIFHLHLANNVEHTVYAISRLHYGLHDALKVLLHHDVDVMRRNYAGPTSLSDYPATLPNSTLAHLQRKFSRHPEEESRHNRPNVGGDTEVLHPCVLKGTYVTTEGGITVGGGGDFAACAATQQRWLELARRRDIAHIAYALPQPLFHRNLMPFVGTDNFAEYLKLAQSVRKRNGIAKHSIHPDAGGRGGKARPLPAHPHGEPAHDTKFDPDASPHGGKGGKAKTSQNDKSAHIGRGVHASMHGGKGAAGDTVVLTKGKGSAHSHKTRGRSAEAVAHHSHAHASHGSGADDAGATGAAEAGVYMPQNHHNGDTSTYLNDPAHSFAQHYAKVQGEQRDAHKSQNGGGGADGGVGDYAQYIQGGAQQDSHTSLRGRTHHPYTHPLPPVNPPPPSSNDSAPDTADAPITIRSVTSCLEDQFEPAQPLDFLEGALLLCAMPWWAVQVELYRFGSSSSTTLRDSCFGLVYMHHLLSQEYRFPSTQQYFPSSVISRCPQLRMADLSLQFEQIGMSERNLERAEEMGLKVTYDSSWALGAVILHMEAEAQES